MKTFRQYVASQIAIKEAKVNTKDDFKEWLFNLYKTAHGDDYDEKIAQDVYDDLIKDYDEDKGFGELMGRASSGLGQ